MNEYVKLYEMITVRLREKEHSEFLKLLIDCFQEGGRDSIESKIREILNKIEV